VAVDASDLGALPLFAGVDAADLEQLARGGERVEVAGAGVELTRQGDFGHALFVVLDGTAEVAVAGRVVRHLGVGDIFGEIAVLASGRRTADVVSSTPMTLVSLFKRDVWAIEEKNDAFAAELRSLRESHR
jgi:CRP-like cAMP-binding protein